MASICSIEGCYKKHKARGYCTNHYYRLLRRGDVHYKPRPLEQHGLKDRYLKEYYVWKGIKGRCLNTNNKAYKNYGGRGISICDRWIHSFKNFLDDMGLKPSPAHSIDRINNDDGYSPENCRWATPTEQSWNRRKNKNNTSEYRGVSYLKTDKKWVANIRVSGENYYMGRHNTPEEAAIEYDKAAVFFRGKEAKTNFL